MDLKKIKNAAKIVAQSGGRMMTVNTAEVGELIDLVERQEKELAGARFAAQSHQNTVELQAAIIDGQQSLADLALPANGRQAAADAGDLLPYWQSQRKMIERAIIGLRDGWATRKDADAALAVLASATPASPASAPEASEREGWKLVPIEPTPEMLDKAGRELSMNDESAGAAECDLEYQADAHTAYAAMIAAAPLPPVVERKELTDEEIAEIVTAAKIKFVHPDARTTLDIARAFECHFTGLSARAPK